MRLSKIATKCSENVCKISKSKINILLQNNFLKLNTKKKLTFRVNVSLCIYETFQFRWNISNIRFSLSSLATYGYKIYTLLTEFIGFHHKNQTTFIFPGAVMCEVFPGYVDTKCSTKLLEGYISQLEKPKHTLFIQQIGRK